MGRRRLGFSLASPFIERFRIKRNPVIVLTGESGTGKSTLLRFAVGAFVTRVEWPFVIEGTTRNTPVSFLFTEYRRAQWIALPI